MRIKNITLFAAAAGLLAACGPGPGSAEWCKGVLAGSIQATAAEMEANAAKCDEVMTKEIMGAIGTLGQ
jgi:hypothetical protein